MKEVYGEIKEMKASVDGKTTYQPYRTDSENLIHLSRKTIANLYRSKPMDISFQFTPWEKDEE